MNLFTLKAYLIVFGACLAVCIIRTVIDDVKAWRDR